MYHCINAFNASSYQHINNCFTSVIFVSFKSYYHHSATRNVEDKCFVLILIIPQISLPDELMPWQTLALDLGRLNKEKRIVEAVKKVKTIMLIQVIE